MITKAIQTDFMIKKADRYFRKAQWLHYLVKWAEETNDLLGRLNEYVDSIKNESLFKQLESLLENYNGFLEEMGPHKPDKDLGKVGHFSKKIRDTLNEIGHNSYINLENNGFFEEDDDFDPEAFLGFLSDLSQDVENRLDEVGDVPEYDEAAEIKMAVLDLFNKAKGDPEFVKVMNTGNIHNSIAYLKQNMPEIAEMMSQIENIQELNANDWEEIMSDMSNIQADPYQQKMRIIDRGKQQEAKKVWIAKNPKKYFEQKQRDWHNLKTNPVRYAKYKEDKKVKRRQYIEDLAQRAENDPLAKAELLRFKEKEKSRAMKHFTGGAGSYAESTTAYKLLNKYLTAIMGEATRSFATKLAVELLAAHPEFSKLKGPEREAKKKEMTKVEAKSSPQFRQYATDATFRFNFVMNNNYSRNSLKEAEKELGPELYPKLLEAIKNYKPRTKG